MIFKHNLCTSQHTKVRTSLYLTFRYSSCLKPQCLHHLQLPETWRFVVLTERQALLKVSDGLPHGRICRSSTGDCCLRRPEGSQWRTFGLHASGLLCFHTEHTFSCTGAWPRRSLAWGLPREDRIEHIRMACAIPPEFCL